MSARSSGGRADAAAGPLSAGSMPVEISAEGMTLMPVAEQEIRTRAAKLRRFEDRLERCRVVVSAPEQHHQQGGPYSVRVQLSVPGEDIVVDRQTATTVVVAIREAFEAARRRLQDHARLQRGAVKRHVGDVTRRPARLS